jgi:hypothetical protein
LEFWSTLFGVDHDLSTGYHRSGGWHIGSTLIAVTGAELNRALAGAGVTVTAANLTTLTNGSVLPAGVLHSHESPVPPGSPGDVFNIYDEESGWGPAGSGWINMPGFEIPITTEGVASFLLLYTHRNASIYDVYIRFTLDNVPSNNPSGYYNQEEYTFNMHGVFINVVAGSHTFRVQTYQPGGYSYYLRKRQFTVVKIGG